MSSIEFFLGCTDTETNIDCLMIVGCAILGMVKTIWFRIYAKNLTHNYSSAVNDYLTIENAKERTIMRKYTFMGRALCSLILSFAYISTMMYALIPFLDFDEIEQVNITNEDKLEYPIPSKCALKYFNVPVSMYRTFCLIETVAIMVACTNNIVIGISYSHYLDSMASGQWSDDVAYAMTPFKLISWPIGVWPLQVYNVYSLIRCTLATCCAALVIVIPSFEVYLGCTDPGTKIDCLMLACAGILGMVKTLSFRIYARKMANNYDSAVNDYLTIENTKERAIMRR
ncbi:uncharacterized protein LOC105432531 [Pogonomyrmex barbatus]|uniref:Uncharacterized protein LOC105432531 n=1 Tax=Pogonomyrmex barbatus TaxID=144034 RepID=A0A8N1SBA8_9HYME|nr:uncharacterized protein LOC105432531 [Pogonomyrmex barbatus]